MSPKRAGLAVSHGHIPVSLFPKEWSRDPAALGVPGAHLTCQRGTVPGPGCGAGCLGWARCAGVPCLGLPGAVPGLDVQVPRWELRWGSGQRELCRELCPGLLPVQRLGEHAGTRPGLGTTCPGGHRASRGCSHLPGAVNSHPAVFPWGGGTHRNVHVRSRSSSRTHGHTDTHTDTRTPAPCSVPPSHPPTLTPGANGCLLGTVGARVGWAPACWGC